MNQLGLGRIAIPLGSYRDELLFATTQFTIVAFALRRCIPSLDYWSPGNLLNTVFCNHSISAMIFMNAIVDASLNLQANLHKILQEPIREPLAASDLAAVISVFG